MALTRRLVKGSALDYTEHDGNIDHFDLKTKDGWNDLVCGLDTRAGPQQPVLTQFIGGIYLYAFDQNTLQEAYCTAHINHDYKLGTMLYPHIHWATDTTDVGTVRWGYEYTMARRSDDTGVTVFGATTTIYVEQTTDGTAYKHYVAEPPELSGIPGTNVNTDTIIMFRVFRDAGHVNDTLNQVAFGFTFDLHYESSQRATKNRAPDFNT